MHLRKTAMQKGRYLVCEIYHIYVDDSNLHSTLGMSSIYAYLRPMHNKAHVVCQASMAGRTHGMHGWHKYDKCTKMMCKEHMVCMDDNYVQWCAYFVIMDNSNVQWCAYFVAMDNSNAQCAYFVTMDNSNAQWCTKHTWYAWQDHVFLQTSWT